MIESNPAAIGQGQENIQVCIRAEVDLAEAEGPAGAEIAGSEALGVSLSSSALPRRVR
jgi:hypothetical protein